MYDPECEKCELASYAETICIPPANTVEGPDALVVVDVPNEIEEYEGQVGESERHDLLKRVLRDVVGFDLDRVIITAAVKCRPPNARYPSDEEVDTCSDYLRQEIEEYDPSVVLALGKVPTKALFGDREMKMGDTYKVKGYPPIIPTYGPGYAQAKGEAILEKFAKHLYKGLLIANGSEGVKNTETVLVETMEEVDELIGYIRDVGKVSLDFETTGLDKQKDYPTMIGASFNHGSGWAVPLYHFETPFSKEEIGEIMGKFKEVWEDPEVQKIAWNTKFELHIADINTPGRIAPKGRVDDAMLLHHLWDENRSHRLKDVASEMFPDFEGYEEQVQQYAWEEVPLKILAPYCVTDTDLTLRIFDYLEQDLEQPLYRVYRNISNAGNLWTFRMEKNGMLIDRLYLEQAIEDVSSILKEKEEELRGFRVVKKFEKKEREQAVEESLKKARDKYTRAKNRAKDGENSLTRRFEEEIRKIKVGEIDPYGGLNFNSPQQLGRLFYGKNGYGHKMPFVKKKGERSPTTDKDFLKLLEDKDGFVQAFLEYRKIHHMYGTYLEGIRDRLAKDDRLHAQFNVGKTVTGRLSCSDPNLQNIPKKDSSMSKTVEDVTARVKSCFTSPEGYVLIQADYSQMELRLVAEYSEDETMLEAYRNGDDIHIKTAQTIKRIGESEWEQFDKDERKRLRFEAKGANFGLIYGAQAETYQEYLRTQYDIHVPYKEAKKQRNAYFNTYSGLPGWHKYQIKKARKNGFVRTIFGRKRRIPEIKSPDNYTRSKGERFAINAPIQGSGGEITIFAGTVLEKRLSVIEPRALMPNTVHDSLFFYLPKDNILGPLKEVIRTMEDPPLLPYFGDILKKVPIEADAEAGYDWGSLEELEEISKKGLDDIL